MHFHTEVSDTIPLEGITRLADVYIDMQYHREGDSYKFWWARVCLLATEMPAGALLLAMCANLQTKKNSFNLFACYILGQFSSDT